MRSRISILAAMLALLSGAPAAVAQEHETHVTLGHDLHAQLSQHYTLPSGLTLSARLGSRDGSTAKLDWSHRDCLVGGDACTPGNIANALNALDTKSLTSAGGAVGYRKTVDKVDLNMSATGTWISGDFTPGLEFRATRDYFVGYVAWHHDISGALTKSLVEHDLTLGRAGVVRVGIGLKF